MAKSLRDLIEYLLGEISLYGDRGASLGAVLGFIDAFYATPEQAVCVAEDHEVDGSGYTARKPNLDGRFKSKVWSWLTRHPEVSVGKNREGNDLDLDEMEARFSATVTADADTGNVEDSAPAASVSTEEPANVQVASPESSGNQELRVFVSEERMWLAIAGHKPDTSRIVPLQFALLSIIASNKGSGIVHPNLSKLSGQDKRSVPKRTDVLQEKGYIEKKAIQIKSVRTTLCTLRKFAGASATEASDNENRMVDFSALLDQIVGCLKESNPMACNDLREKIGIRQPWNRKILSRALRKLDTIGCVRRVKAFSQYTDVIKTRYLALMLVREPTEQDRRQFDDRRSFAAFLEQDDVDELEGVEEDQTEAAFEEDRKSQQDLLSRPDVEDVGRVAPQWVPGTSLTSLIMRSVDESGFKGMTTIEAARATLGISCRRPMMIILSRLMEAAQQPQPPHLRRLSLVRDATLRKTNFLYLHYSLRNFMALVDSGQASWETVDMGPQGATYLPSHDTELELDDYGLPVRDLPQGILKGGNASLRECLEAAGPNEYRVTTHDPMPLKLADGTYDVQYLGARGRKAMRRAAAIDSTPTEQDFSPDGKRRRAAGAGSGEEEAELMMGPAPKRRKKEKPDPFAGMSEKERLEAQGFDESWTEYSILCLERTDPGVYLTPSGRRRPAGKARGRPPRSRIAIFRLPKLKEVEWFVRPPEGEGSPNEPVATTTGEGTVAPTEEVTEVEPCPSSRSTRRKQPRRAAAQSRPYLEHSESDVESPVDVQDTAAESASASASASGMSTSAIETAKQAKKPPRRKGGMPPKKRQKVGHNTAAEIDAEVPSQSQDVPRDSAQVASTDGILDTESMQVDRPDLSAVSQDIDSSDEVQKTHPTVTTKDSEAARGSVRISSKATAMPHDQAPLPDLPDLPTTTVPATESSSIDGQAHIPSIEAPAANDQQDTQLSRPISPSIPQHSETRDETAAADESTREASTPVKLDRQSVDVPSLSGGKKAKRTVRRDRVRGSVAMIRKQIVMDIVKQCGGVYPMGAALWYPFTTAWLRKQFRERPDMKTLRSTVGSLVESGKLHQYTFSGRNPKGFMVTKSLIADAELEADDQRITDLQTAMLNADPIYYLPPGADVEQGLKKYHNNLPRSVAQDTDLTVTLHQTPMRVHKREELAERALERERARKQRAKTKKPHVPRLKTIRNQWEAPPTTGPYIRVWGHRKLGPWQVSRLVPRGLSMLMKQRSVFDTATGTFGTVSLEARNIRSLAQREPPLSEPTQPQNLDDILSEAREPGYPVWPATRTAAAEFFEEIDAVHRWEKENNAFLPTNNDQFTYINHGVSSPFQSVPLEGTPRFESDVAFEPMPAPVLPNYPALRFRPILSSAAPRPVSRPVPKSAVSPMAVVRRQRQMEDRLITAMVVVRTLAGGLDSKMIDWAIVGSLFPEYSLKYIHDQGKSLLHRNRLQMVKMQDDFRQMFAEAYERDEVPPIDYNNLEFYNWDWVVNWAEGRLEMPRASEQHAPRLPATRAQFDNLFEIRMEPVQDIDEVYQPVVVGMSIPRKRSLLSNVAFSIPVKSSATATASRAREADAERLRVAKTWVRANVVTPEESYWPPKARETLQRFGSDLIDRAISSLMTERVIMKSNRGRVTPGRNFVVTDHFLYTLGRKRAIEPAQLKRAVNFKTEVLDQKFRAEGKYVVQDDAGDGDILAVINLAHEGRVTISPRNPPRNKFGLTEAGYRTRQMDKAKLRFAVDVTTVEGSYIYGDPVRHAVDQIPVPRGEMDLHRDSTPVYLQPSSPPGKIPLWFDVHRQLMSECWDSVLCAALGTVALRQGMQAEGIAKVLHPCVASWEVELVLDWLQRVGAVRRVRDGDGENDASSREGGWKVNDWWWMVIK